MVLVNDPFFPKEAVGQYEEKPLKQQSRSTKHKFQTHVIEEAGDSGRELRQCVQFVMTIMRSKNVVKYF